MKKTGFWIVLVLILGATVYVGLNFYSYIFAKTVQGEIIGVERVMQPAAIINQNGGPADSTQMFSFAIAIRDAKSQEIFTGSSEDRQWAVVQKGQCAVAKFFPYPFWKMDKAGTYFGTRLLSLYDCPKSPK